MRATLEGARRAMQLSTGLLATQFFATSLEALARYRLRTALSVLGVMLGVAAVIAMMSVSNGARVEALQQIEQLGLSNIILRSTAAAPRPGLADRVLLARDANAIKELIPLVRSVTPLIERYMWVSSPRDTQMAAVLGVEAGYGQVLDLMVRRGRFLAEPDVRAQARVCVLGAGVSRTLFGYRSPIGQRVRVGVDWYEVVGVLPDRTADARAIGTVAARDLNQVVVVPISALVGRSERFYSAYPVNEVWIRLEDGGAVTEVGAIVDSTLSRLRQGLVDYEVVIPRELLNQRVRTQRTFSVVVGSVAVLSLLIGGIGIMNIMLASVLERTKEIGIRRTVGATRRDITLQFLTESLLMTVGGGTIGILLGIVIAYGITAYAEWATRLSVFSVFLAFSVSFVVGVVFGLYPAVKAARLNPIDAVRYE